MITNVSIRFNSVEEYREIESKLVEMGYKCNKGDKEYSNITLREMKKIPHRDYHVIIFEDLDFFAGHCSAFKNYNSLQEFLDDK